MGTVTVERSGITLENLAVTDNATTGVFVGSSGAVIRGVYIARNGMLGLSGNHADNLLVDRVLSEANNLEHFNSAPVSGGSKVTRSRSVTFQNSVFRYNYGPGMWFDESTFDMRIAGNETRSNTGHGISLEISATAVVVNNIIESNPGGQGIKVNNVSNVKIWNNTFVGNGRSVNLVQDARRYGDGSPGKDPRYPNDPAMTWSLGPVMVANNVIANQDTGNCLLCVEDYSKQRSAEQIGVTADGNVYNRPSAGSPSWVVVWSRGSGNPDVYSTLDAFKSATGQEGSGVLVTGPGVVTDFGVPTGSMPSPSIARPLPSDVAAIAGWAAGTRYLGAA
jgi:parallel beta-helix repeat protein